MVGDGEDRRVEILCDPDELHATWTRFGPHRDGASPHVHRLHSDLFYVLAGELTFIVGGDMAVRLPTWREPAEILRRARLGVAERGEIGREQIDQVLAPYDATIDYFTMPRIDISSTDIRARAAAGRGFAHLVPAAVAEVVAQRGLYR